jgi:hypothetical protein
MRNCRDGDLWQYARCDIRDNMTSEPGRSKLVQGGNIEIRGVGKETSVSSIPLTRITVALIMIEHTCAAMLEAIGCLFEKPMIAVTRAGPKGCMVGKRVEIKKRERSRRRDRRCDHDQQAHPPYPCWFSASILMGSG